MLAQKDYPCVCCEIGLVEPDRLSYLPNLSCIWSGWVHRLHSNLDGLRRLHC